MPTEFELIKQHFTYAAPRTLEDIVDQTVGRSLDLFGYDWPDVQRWGENIAKSKRKPKGAR